MAQTTRPTPTNGIDHYMNKAVDPTGKEILDPYSFVVTDIHYNLRHSIGTSKLITVATAGVPDLVSWQEYRTHDYWWLILIVNKMIRGEKEMISGTTLYVPTISDLGAYIESLRRKRIGGRIVSLGVTPTTTPPR
jgi:hypothetical protein